MVLDSLCLVCLAWSTVYGPVQLQDAAGGCAGARCTVPFFFGFCAGACFHAGFYATLGDGKENRLVKARSFTIISVIFMIIIFLLLSALLLSTQESTLIA